MVSQLPTHEFTELNPFRPGVPEEIRAISPGLFEFLRQLVLDIRDQHNKTQAGDTSFNWQVMLALDDEPRYTLGSTGRFYHETYGLIQARYVQFDSMLPDLWSGAPVGALAANGFDWGVGNNYESLPNKSPLGVPGAFTVPKNGQYGWIIVAGINTQELHFVGESPPAVQDVLFWLGNDSVGASSLLGVSLGSIQTLDGVEQVDSTHWKLPPASVLITTGSAGADLSGLEDRIGALGSRLNIYDAIALGDQIKRVEARIDIANEYMKGSLSILAQRTTRVTPDELSIELLNRLTATANYFDLSKFAAEEGLRGARESSLLLTAVQEETRKARVYRDGAEFGAQSSIEFYNLAAVKSNLATASAEASALLAQSAEAYRDAAGVYSAQAALSAELAAEAANEAGTGEGTVDSVARANIAIEALARTDGDSANTTLISELQTDFDTFEAATGAALTAANTRITNAISGSSSATEAVASDIESLEATFTSYQGVTDGAIEALVDQDNAILTYAIALVTAESTARATAEYAATLRINSAESAIGIVNTRVANEETTRSTAISGEAAARTTLGATLGTAITTAQSAATAAGGAIGTAAAATARTNAVSDAAGLIAAERVVRVGAEGALAAETSSVKAIALTTRPNLIGNSSGELGTSLMNNGGGGPLVYTEALWGPRVQFRPLVMDGAIVIDSFVCGPGQIFTFTGDSLALFITNPSTYFDVIFVDAGGATVGDSTQGVVNGPHDFSDAPSRRDAHKATDIAPAGTARGLVRFVWSLNGQAPDSGMLLGFRQVKVELGTSWTPTASMIGIAAVARKIDVVSSQLDDNTFDITQISESIDGITGRYGVVLNENGVVTGSQLLSGSGGVSEFKVQATSVKLGNGDDAFEVVGGVTRIKNVAIGGGTINWANMNLADMRDTDRVDTGPGFGAGTVAPSHAIDFTSAQATLTMNPSGNVTVRGEGNFEITSQDSLGGGAPSLIDFTFGFYYTDAQGYKEIYYPIFDRFSTAFPPGPGQTASVICSFGYENSILYGDNLVFTGRQTITFVPFIRSGAAANSVNIRLNGLHMTWQWTFI